MEISPTDNNKDSPLLRCPRSLQDRIFRLAYPPGDPVRPVVLTGWQAHQSGDSEKLDCPLTTHKVNEFLVSKKYLAAAARTWSRNQVFDIRHVSSEQLLYPGGIISAFAKAVMLQANQVKYLNSLPRVEFLTIDVIPSDLSPHIAPCSTRLQDQDLQSTRLFTDLSHVRGHKLKHITLRALNCPEAHNEFQAQLWKQNVRCLEELIMRRQEQNKAWRIRVLKMCQRSKSDGKLIKSLTTRCSQRPLYSGSSIYFDIHTTPTSSAGSAKGNLSVDYSGVKPRVMSSISDDLPPLLVRTKATERTSARCCNRHGSLSSIGDVAHYTSSRIYIPDPDSSESMITFPNSSLAAPASPSFLGQASTAEGEEIHPLDLDTMFSCATMRNVTPLDEIHEPSCSVRQTSIGADTTVISLDTGQDLKDEAEMIVTGQEKETYKAVVEMLDHDEGTSGTQTCSAWDISDENQSLDSLLADVVSGGGMLMILSLVWYVTHTA